MNNFVWFDGSGESDDESGFQSCDEFDEDEAEEALREGSASGSVDILGYSMEYNGKYFHINFYTPVYHNRGARSASYGSISTSFVFVPILIAILALCPCLSSFIGFILFYFQKINFLNIYLRNRRRSGSVRGFRGILPRLLGV